MKLDTTGKVVLFAVFSGKGADAISDMAIDPAGNIYVAGSTSSVNLPLHNAFQSTPGPGFVIKFNPDATQMIYSTYFPGTIAALAVDSAGSVYVTGLTSAANFPVTAGLPAASVGSGPPTVFGAFLTKLSPAGDKILYSTVIAGHGKDCGSGSSCFLSQRYTAGVAVAVDAAGSAYIAGNTDTTDLPATTGAFLEHGTGAFVARVEHGGNGSGVSHADRLHELHPGALQQSRQFRIGAGSGCGGQRLPGGFHVRPQVSRYCRRLSSGLRRPGDCPGVSAPAL